MLGDAGFRDINVLDHFDYFEGSPDESTRKTAKTVRGNIGDDYRGEGINISTANNLFYNSGN